MKKVFYMLAVIVMAGCAPGKSGKFVTVKVLCDSCKLKFSTEWYKGDDHGKETAWDGIVIDSVEISIERFISDIPCVRVQSIENYSTDTINIFYFENGAIISHEIEDNIAGYCN